MPYYEYRSAEDTGCDYCAEPFTILQKMDDPVMQRCPYCSRAVKRLISSPSLPGRHSKTPSTSEVEKAGFTQYRKIDRGVYEKSAGKGPKIISAD